MTEESGSSSGNSDRRVANLQGLLNFCTEATASEDPTQPTSLETLSNERREFLENVLHSMQCDTSAVMARTLQKFNNPNIDALSDITELEDALDSLAELAEDINHAIVLEKIHGFPIVVDILRCSHSSLQAKACQLIGDICQNNEACQKSMLSLGTMVRLLKLIDKHPDDEVRAKALYALSCLTRDFEPSEEEFVKHSGFCFLMRAIQTRKPRLVIKAVFFLNYFTEKADKYKDTLLSMGFVEQLVSVLFETEDADGTTREYCTLSLLNLASSYPPALNECRRPEFKLAALLDERRARVAGKEECQEEQNHIESLLALMQGDEDDDESSFR